VRRGRRDAAMPRKRTSFKLSLGYAILGFSGRPATALAAIGSLAIRLVTEMKFGLLVSLCALVLVHPSPVYALDCGKASSKVENLFCVTPELKRTDEAMSAAYFNLLRETTNAEFHEALIQSQRRWLKVRSDGPDRYGQAENDKTDDSEVLLKMTRDRQKFLQTAEPVQIMEQQREARSKDSGGAFAAFRTYCVLQPPPYGKSTRWLTPLAIHSPSF
jgi:uncharacterized protein YecT (DUF1311 family)